MENRPKNLDSKENSFRQGKIIFEDDHQRFTKPVFAFSYFYKILILAYKSEYVRVPFDYDVDALAKYIANEWLKKNPKIIIPVITGLSHFKPWKNQKQLNKFKRGIIKV